ncbi:hypothetical protein GCM10027347_32000 [Larkinella harenae]
MNTVSQPTFWPERLLVYGLIAVSGIEYFYHNQEYVIVLLLAACLVAIVRKTRFTFGPLVIILVVFLLQLLQAIQFNNFVPASLLPLLTRLAVVYLITHICGLNTIKWFVEIIFYSAVISLPIYFLTYIPEAERFLVQNVAQVYFKPLFSIGEGLASPTILVYTFNPFAVDQLGGFLLNRNCGPFWGPDTFAALINLALVFNIIRKKTMINKRNAWLAVVQITTFSTVGSVTLLLICLGYLLTEQVTARRIRQTSLLAVLFAALLVVVQMNRAGMPLQESISLTQPDENPRLNSAYLDLSMLLKSPLVGVGQAGRNQAPFIQGNNGIIALLVTYGIPAALLYLAMLFLFFWFYCQFYGFATLFAVFAFLSVLLSGFSQTIFDRPVLLALLFLADRLTGTFSEKNIRRPRVRLSRSKV